MHHAKTLHGPVVLSERCLGWKSWSSFEFVPAKCDHVRLKGLGELRVNRAFTDAGDR